MQRQQSPTNGAYKAVSVRKGLPSSVNLTLPPLAVVILRPGDRRDACGSQSSPFSILTRAGIADFALGRTRPRSRPRQRGSSHPFFPAFG